MRKYTFSLNVIFLLTIIFSANSYAQEGNSIVRIDQINRQVIDGETKSGEFPVNLKIKTMKFEAADEFSMIYDDTTFKAGDYRMRLLRCLAHRKDAHAQATYHNVNLQNGLTAQINFSKSIDSLWIEIQGSKIIDAIKCTDFETTSDLYQIFSILNPSALKIDIIDENFSDSSRVNEISKKNENMI